MDKAEREELLKGYEELLAFRTNVLKNLEEARNNQVIGSSQQALVKVAKNGSFARLMNKHGLVSLAKSCVVSEIKPVEGLQDDEIQVIHHEGKFCERCWNYEDDAVEQSDGTYLCKRCQEVVGK